MAAQGSNPPHTLAKDGNIVTVSVREISDVTYRLLCAAGVPAGSAARAAAMVQYAEVHRGIGLSLLHGQLDLIERGGADPSGLMVRHVTDGLSLVDKTGSMLAAGPPAMDLARAHAAGRGVGIVYIRDAVGPSLLSELAYRATAYDDSVCTVSWVTAADEKPPGRGCTLITGPGANGRVGLERSSTTAPALLSTVADMIRDGSSTSTCGGDEMTSVPLAAEKPLDRDEIRELVNSVLVQNGADSGSKIQGAAIVCGRVVPGCSSWFEPMVLRAAERTDGARVHTKTTMDHAWSVACARGVDVDSKVWSELYALSRKILVAEHQESRP